MRRGREGDCCLEHDDDQKKEKKRKKNPNLLTWVVPTQGNNRELKFIRTFFYCLNDPQNAL